MSLPTTRCEGRCNVCHEQHHELQDEVERLKDKLEIKTGACEFNRVAYAQCREERVALQAQVERLTQERDRSLSNESAQKSAALKAINSLLQVERKICGLWDELRGQYAELDSLRAQSGKVSALQQQVMALRDAMEKIKLTAIHGCGTKQKDFRGKYFASIIVAATEALTQPPESDIKAVLAKMSPQLRNVLYDLIRKVPPLADHGDQQAMNEFIAEVMPSPEPAPEVKP